MVDVLLVYLDACVHFDRLGDEPAKRASPLDDSSDGYPEELIELLILFTVFVYISYVIFLLKFAAEVLQIFGFGGPGKGLSVNARRPLVVQRLVKNIQQTLQMDSLQLYIAGISVGRISFEVLNRIVTTARVSLNFSKVYFFINPCTGVTCL